MVSDADISKLVYTVDEAVKVGAFPSRMALYKRIYKGEVPGVRRLGPRTIRIDKDLFDAWLRERGPEVGGESE